MSNQYLKLRRSAVPGKIPTTSSLDFGEIALNTYDGLAFMKKSGPGGEEIITLGGSTGSFAITGSNIFSGSQVITGSVDISGSLTVNTVNVGANTLNFIDNNRNILNSLSVSGNNILLATGSIETTNGSFFSGSFTGSLHGTSSWATNFVSASNYVLNSQTASFATTGSNTFIGNQTITGSLNASGSTHTITGSLRATSFTGSLQGTASWATNAITSSYPIRVIGSTLYSIAPLSTNNPNTNQNIFLGLSAGTNNNGTYGSIFIGPSAGSNANISYASNFIGSSAGSSANSAYLSNFIGTQAGSETSANNSNFIGTRVGTRAYNSSYSILIGYQAGTNIDINTYNNITTNGIGQNNIIIGTNITLEENRKDSINIGGIIFGTGSYFNNGSIPFSGSANGKIGINVVNPTYTLDVSGSGNFSNNLTVTGSVRLSDVLILSPQHPLPSGKPTGSLAVSGSEADCKIYFFNGSWNALF